MKKVLLYIMVATLGLFSTRCEYDNYDPPTSILSGNVMYNNVPVGVRSGATQLELWQYSWNTRGVIAKAKIVVNIDQNGFYSSRLYDGDYKLVRLKGGPWADQTDSIAVSVRGNTTLDVPVSPFFVINNPVFTFSGTDITSTCNLTKLGTYNITSLTLYVGLTNIVDQNNSSQTNVLSASALTDLSTAKTNKVTLTAANLGRSYVYVRLGVLSAGSSERYYTPVQKISLSGN
ncbi:MAG TPA: DUF3823 domain-containing protein [Bacteroidales bacterium]|nr:DUF3823 domain-containing protein [Bacteroidales bacterium]